jgi:hypothetical protein
MAFFSFLPDGVRDAFPAETKRGTTMTHTTFITIQQLFADNLTVSRKQKPVLKHLKACKPGGHGRKPSAVHADRRPFVLSFQEERTSQWNSSTTLPDQQ